MELLIILLSVAFIVLLVIVLLVIELPVVMAYGRLANSKKVVSYIIKAKNAKRLSLIDKSMIGISGGTYISSIPFSLLCKWEIDEVGRVPRWSKAHKLIEKTYRELRLEGKDEYDYAFGE